MLRDIFPECAGRLPHFLFKNPGKVKLRFKAGFVGYFRDGQRCFPQYLAGFFNF